MRSRVIGVKVKVGLPVSFNIVEFRVIKYVAWVWLESKSFNLSPHLWSSVFDDLGTRLNNQLIFSWTAYWAFNLVEWVNSEFKTLTGGSFKLALHWIKLLHNDNKLYVIAAWLILSYLHIALGTQTTEPLVVLEMSTVTVSSTCYQTPLNPTLTPHWKTLLSTLSTAPII